MLDEMKSLQKLENASHKKALEISNLLTFSLKTTQETKKSVNKISSDFCIILFIRNGQASLFIDDNCIKLNRYDLVIISPKTAYHLDTSDKQDIVTILSMPIPFIQQRLLPLIKQNELLHNIFSKISYDFDLHSAYLFFKNTSGKALHSFNNLLYEFQNSQDINQRISTFYLAILLEEVTQIYDIYHKENLFTKEKIDINDILKYIEENFSTITLNSLAEKFHYSSAYLSTLFKKKTSKNFTEYVKNIKMEKASHYLLTTDKTVDEIAIILGYSDRSQFFLTFKNYYNVTPSQYKKKTERGNS